MDHHPLGLLLSMAYHPLAIQYTYSIVIQIHPLFLMTPSTPLEGRTSLERSKKKRRRNPFQMFRHSCESQQLSNVLSCLLIPRLVSIQSSHLLLLISSCWQQSLSNRSICRQLPSNNLIKGHKDIVSSIFKVSASFLCLLQHRPIPFQAGH